MLTVDMLDEELAKIYPNGVDCHKGLAVGSDGIVFKHLEGKRPTVDELLDCVDVELTWYVPSDFAIEFVMFISLVLGESPQNKNSKPQYFMIDCMFQQLNVKPYFMVRNINFDDMVGETVILCSREFGKSALVTYFILYMAYKQFVPGFGRVNYGLYVSDSMRNNVKKMMGRLKGIYNESRFLQDKFEEVAITQEEAVFVRKPETKKELESYRHTVEIEKKPANQVPGRMKRIFKVDGLGASTSSRGASNLLSRPDFFICDDMIANEKDARSDAVLDSIESTIESDVRGGMSGNGYFGVLIGTPYNKSDPIYSRIESAAALPVVFPRAEQMPTDDLDKSVFKSVWPDRHTYKNCRKEYVAARMAKQMTGNNQKMRSLLQEHYLRISDQDERMIPDSMLQWYSRKSLGRYLEGYKLYMTTDFTASNTIDNGDYSVIAMWACTNNKDWFMLDLVCRRMTIQQQFTECVNMVQKWSVSSGQHITVGVEIDGQQQTNIYSLQELQRKHQVWFSFASQIGQGTDKFGISRRRSGNDKHGNFMQIQHLFFDRKIFFPEELAESPDMLELMDELKYITYTSINSKHDDALDVISMLGLVNVIYPNVDVVTHKVIDTVDSSWNVYKSKENFMEDEYEDAGWASYI